MKVQFACLLDKKVPFNCTENGFNPPADSQARDVFKKLRQYCIWRECSTYIALKQLIATAGLP